jgi:hypothetical protein
MQARNVTLNLSDLRFLLYYSNELVFINNFRYIK